VRGVIVNDDGILLCRTKGNEFYHFIGGGIEFGETARAALRREIKEEFDGESLSEKFIGIHEHIFTAEGETHHHMNFVFEVRLSEDETIEQEDHTEIKRIPITELGDVKILPKELKEKILGWLNDKKTFFELEE